MNHRLLASFLTGLFLTSGAAAAYAESGTASVYGGGDTASGEQQNSGAHTAAHRTLPFGTMVQVTNRDNGRSITVRINDAVLSSVAGWSIWLLPTPANWAFPISPRST